MSVRRGALLATAERNEDGADMPDMADLSDLSDIIGAS